MILSKGAEQIERMRRLVCAFVVRKFLALRPMQLIRGAIEIDVFWSAPTFF